MSKFTKVKQEDDLISVFKPVFEVVNGLSKYISIFIMVTKSSYSGNFYILDDRGNRITNTVLEEDNRVDGNKWDKAVERVAKTLRTGKGGAEAAYDPDCLNVYTVTVDNGHVHIEIQYLDNTGHEMYAARKKWMLG